MEATIDTDDAKPLDKMLIAEIAEELHRRLQAIGSTRNPDQNPIIKGHITKFYCPVVKTTGRYVSVRYQLGRPTTSSLTKQQAGQYLQWLRAGNIGTHREANV